MKYVINSAYKGYTTACCFLILRVRDKQKMGKLNTSAEVVYSALVHPVSMPELITKLADELSLDQSSIQTDIESCVASLVQHEYVIEMP